MQTASPKCVSASGTVCSQAAAETDTSQSVRMVFMINWQSGPSSCNYHERFLFFSIFSKPLVQCMAAKSPGHAHTHTHKITFDLKNQSHVRSMFSPAESHSLHALPAVSTVRVAPSSLFPDAFRWFQPKCREAVCVPKGKACETDTALLFGVFLFFARRARSC